MCRIQGLICSLSTPTAEFLFARRAGHLVAVATVERTTLRKLAIAFPEPNDYVSLCSMFVLCSWLFVVSSSRIFSEGKVVKEFRRKDPSARTCRDHATLRSQERGSRQRVVSE
jgi:hypothetical protein